MTIEGVSSVAAPRRIRLGMVGGGRGAFIGGVHRMAARLDDRYELVAGALSSDAARAAASAAELHIAPQRSYADYADMARREAAREDGIDVVAIVTPNHLHGRIASAFLDAGIDVICDKPMTTTLAEALALVAKVRDTQRLFALTHNYSGYPMVRQAREMVAAGELGELRVIQAEYPQDWLSTDLEATGQKQASWRVDPAQAGAGGSLGDIGSHAEHLARFISGLELAQVSADLKTFIPAAGSTTTAMCCCATRTARAACSGRARSLPATRMRCACVSTAARPVLRSRRSIPTSSGSRRWAAGRS